MFLYETGYSPADGLHLGLVGTWGPGFFFPDSPSAEAS